MNTLTPTQPAPGQVATAPAATDATPQYPDLQAKLMALTKYGRPRVTLLKGGWYCVVEMNTPAIGASFEVKSDFDHPTPVAAVDQAATRVRAAISAYGGKAA